MTETIQRLAGPPFLTVVGVSHSTAPIHVRERLAVSADDLRAELEVASRHFAECVILSTCNRFEVYVVSPREPRTRGPNGLPAGLLGESYQALEPYTYHHTNSEAAGHLFGVASGIDSLVLGEVQILGQVQRAWQAAHEVGAAGPVLSQLFHRAVALGKRAHSETDISRLPASVSYAAVTLARQIFGRDLSDRRVLIIGTGEVGEGVARCLHEHGVRCTVVAHRQLERAHAVARRYSAEVATWDRLPDCLAAADIVVSSTAAPHFILQRKHVEEAARNRRGRQGRPLYLIDLALPRDIEPAAAEVPGVSLHNLDDLQAVVRTTLEERQAALPTIRAMIDFETARFTDWLKARSTAPAIRRLREEADRVVASELEWAMRKLPDLSHRERQVIEAMSARIAGKLLHGPIQWVKARASEAPEQEYDIEPDELVDLFYRDPEHTEAGEE